VVCSGEKTLNQAWKPASISVRWNNCRRSDGLAGTGDGLLLTAERATISNRIAGPETHLALSAGLWSGPDYVLIRFVAHARHA
jgi:hypothetical protein